MIRSLWTAATGMNSQQTNVDTIANNLANVNTVGYKTEQNQFKSLLYQNLQTETTSANGENKPSSAQVGLGVRNAAITSIFTQGALQATENTTDFALEGDGFFGYRGSDNRIYYTRNGSFNWSLNNNGGLSLTTSDGHPVLNTAGNPITLARGTVASKVEISSEGVLSYPNADNVMTSLNITIGRWQFNNPAGLEKVGDSSYAVTAASGEALSEATNNTLKRSKIVQGYLEGSNVKVADEMVNLIVAQRAYEMNSKAITTSDEMMSQANNLKR